MHNLIYSYYIKYINHINHDKMFKKYNIPNINNLNNIKLSNFEYSKKSIEKSIQNYIKKYPHIHSYEIKYTNTNMIGLFLSITTFTFSSYLVYYFIIR